MSRLRRSLLLLLLALPLRAAGPMVVVVNPQCPIQTLTRQQTANLFLGSTRRFPSGDFALPIEQTLPEATRSQFYRSLNGMPLAAVRTVWARLLFSGQGQPPRQTESSEALTEFVATHKHAVGFLEQSQVTERVKVVLVLD